MINSFRKKTFTVSLFVYGTFICISKYALDHSDKISGDNAAEKQTKKKKENNGGKLYA